jgi:hypothetical protein
MLFVNQRYKRDGSGMDDNFALRVGPVSTAKWFERNADPRPSIDHPAPGNWVAHIGSPTADRIAAIRG